MSVIAGMMYELGLPVADLASHLQVESALDAV